MFSQDALFGSPILDLELLEPQLIGDDGGSQPPAQKFPGQRLHAAQHLQRP
jgi:hypothetical protein